MKLLNFAYLVWEVYFSFLTKLECDIKVIGHSGGESLQETLELQSVGGIDCAG